jgi:hypothetical protein
VFLLDCFFFVKEKWGMVQYRVTILLSEPLTRLILLD